MDKQIKQLNTGVVVLAIAVVASVAFLAFWMFQEMQNNDQANKEAFRQILENKLQIQKLENQLSNLNKK